MCEPVMYADFVTCPYCGYVNEDQCDYEFNKPYGDENSFICGSCNREFTVIENASISYNSYPIGQLEGEG